MTKARRFECPEPRDQCSHTVNDQFRCRERRFVGDVRRVSRRRRLEERPHLVQEIGHTLWDLHHCSQPSHLRFVRSYDETLELFLGRPDVPLTSGPRSLLWPRYSSEQENIAKHGFASPTGSAHKTVGLPLLAMHPATTAAAMRALSRASWIVGERSRSIVAPHGCEPVFDVGDDAFESLAIWP